MCPEPALEPGFGMTPTSRWVYTHALQAACVSALLVVVFPIRPLALGM